MYKMHDEHQRARAIRRQVSETFNEYVLSCFSSYERRFDGSDANNKRVAIYRHNAWGDCLMASAIPRYMKTKWPKCEIYLYTHPAMFQFFLGNPCLEGGMAIPLPMSFDAIKNFMDWHILYEGMLENNSERDQNNCYDDFFAFAGMRDVPDHFKRPSFSIRPDDYDALDYLKGDSEVNLDLSKKYIIYHLSPANENRCYPLLYARRFWDMFLGHYPDYTIYVVGLDPDGRRKVMFQGLEGRAVNLLSKLHSFRHHMPLIENARLMICPDSCFGHAGAVFPHVPVISLWGPFHPNDRVKYYPNHYPIIKTDACRFCPCHDHTFDIPIEKCKKGGNWDEIRETYNAMAKKYGAIHDPNTLDQWCAVLAAITPEELLSMASKLLAGHKTDDHKKDIEESPATPQKLTKEDFEEMTLDGVSI